MNEGPSHDFGVREKIYRERERENEAGEYRHVTHIQAEHVLSAMDHLCVGFSAPGSQLADSYCPPPGMSADGPNPAEITKPTSPTPPHCCKSNLSKRTL